MAERSMDLADGNDLLSTTDDPDYRSERKMQQAGRYVPLLIAAGLPLLDGFFLSFLATGLWQQPAQAVAFGLSAFSGAACVVTAMRLKGSLRQRLGGVTLIYLLLASGATLIMAARPFFESLLPENLNLFTAVFLIGLAFQVSGEAQLQRYAGYLGWTAAVKVMIFGSLLQGVFYGVNWHFTPDATPFRAVIIAVGAGFALTIVGVLLGYFLSRTSESALRPFRLSATVSLLMMGLNILGLGIASSIVLGPLVIGIIWTVALTLRPVT